MRGDGAGARPHRMRVQKAEAQAQNQGDRSVEGHLAQTDGDVAQAQAEVEAGSLKLADEDEAVDAGVEQQDLVEDGQVRRPRPLEPAQIDGESEDRQDQEVAPVAALGGLGSCTCGWS